MCRNASMTSLFWARSCEKEQRGRGANSVSTDSEVKGHRFDFQSAVSVRLNKPGI